MENKKQGAQGIAKDQKSNFGSKGWLLIIFCVFLFYFGGGNTNDGVNAFVPMFSGMFGWSSGLLYTLNTIGGWVGIIGAVLFSWISTKKNVKVATVISLLVGAFALWFWGTATSVTGFAVALFLTTIAGNGYMQVSTSTLAANWFPTKKGLAMGWMTIGCNISTALYVRIFTGAMGKWGLSGGFNLYAVVMVVLAIIAAVFLKSNPEEAGAFPDNDSSMTPEDREKLFELGREYERTSPWTVSRLLKNKTVWLIGVAYGAIILITMGTASQIIPTLMSFGYTQEFALNMMTVAAVVGIVFSYLFGVLDAKIGTKKASLVFYVWTALAIIFMALPGSWTIYPAIFFMGGFLGAGNNFTASIVTTVFGRYDFANAWKVIFPITIVVRSFGYAIVGVLAERTGGYTVPYIVLLVIAVIAFILISVMDDTCVGRNYLEVSDEQ